MNGLSITLVFGKYGGFNFRFESYVWRICLGWVALTIYPRDDLETYITRLRDEVVSAKSKRKRHA